MATSKKMAVVMVFMAAMLLLATVESSAAAVAAATATPSDSNQQLDLGLGLGATRKLLQVFKDTCGGQGCNSPLDCCFGSPLCTDNICSTILQ
jgi:hypothetical protein